MRPTKPKSWFSKLSKWTSRAAGRSITFILAASVILLWIVTGPMFNFSDTWQLVINTATTIVTFLMVFLIQGSQNRDSEALQVKIDELICVTKDARKELMNLEELDEKELDSILAAYLKLAADARENK